MAFNKIDFEKKLVELNLKYKHERIDISNTSSDLFIVNFINEGEVLVVGLFLDYIEETITFIMPSILLLEKLPVENILERVNEINATLDSGAVYYNKEKERIGYRDVKLIPKGADIDLKDLQSYISQTIGVAERVRRLRHEEE